MSDTTPCRLEPISERRMATCQHCAYSAWYVVADPTDNHERDVKVCSAHRLRECQCGECVKAAREEVEYRLREALMTVYVADDPPRTGCHWPDPIAHDGRLLAQQARDLLAIGDCDARDVEERHLTPLAEALRALRDAVAQDVEVRKYERAADVLSHLCDADTGESLRVATPDEVAESEYAARVDGGSGIILVAGRRCYVPAPPVQVLP